MVALLPVLFAAATLFGAHYLDEDRESGIGDVLSNWYFLVVVGSVVIVSVVVISLCGVAALTRWFRIGRLLSTVGCTAALLAAGALTFAGANMWVLVRLWSRGSSAQGGGGLKPVQSTVGSAGTATGSTCCLWTRTHFASVLVVRKW